MDRIYNRPEYKYICIKYKAIILVLQTNTPIYLFFGSTVSHKLSNLPFMSLKVQFGGLKYILPAFERSPTIQG